MSAVALMPSRYDPGVVALSLLIAAFASYVALDLARRVRGPDRFSAQAWTVGGALVMGSGIWSMHFVGMLAFKLPIALGYRADLTLASWVAAVGVSGLALRLAARERLGLAALGGGALAMGGGICAMHYLGMAAIDVAPGIVWDPALVAASAAVAVAASAAALWIFFAVRRLQGLRARAAQVAAALAMGGAISGMHYTGMAAAGFPAGALCLSADALGGDSLGTVLVAATVVLLSITLFTSVLDARLQARAMRLARSLEATHQQLQQANAELQRLAFSDPLTGLPNLARFDDRLEHALARTQRQPGVQLAVLFIDLDGFKPVNDGLGHAAGDQLLRQVAARLRAAGRAGDTLARLGGDEFVVLLEDLDGPEAALVLAQRLRHGLARPFDLDGRRVRVSASIGLALFPDHGAGERLKSMADAAMHAAKRAGGNRVACFEPSMLAHATDPLDLLQDLRCALEARQLALHYQPKVEAATGRVRGVEALLRWSHPQRGAVSPATFVPLAERNGLIVPIGNWVLDEACRQIAAWQREGRRLRVSINLSAWQVRQPDFVDRMQATLQRHGADPRLLVCEFTESVAMDDALATQRVIDALESLGVRLSIDDFGTGHSSLAMLRQLRVHELKVDRLFVQDVAQDRRARELVGAVVRIAHVLGMTVVAEGVETAAQQRALVALGCDELQGYLFARPLPAAGLVEAADALGFAPSAFATALPA